VFEILCAAIAVVCALACLTAFSATRDALHPAVFISPLFGYFYGLWPIMLNNDGGLEALVNPSDLAKVALVFLLSLSALFVGLLWGTKDKARALAVTGQGRGFLVLPAEKSDRLFKLSVLLGGLAVIAYVIQLDNVGGFMRAYSRAKGGGSSGSGYIGEGILLSFPAILFLALSVRASGGRVRLVHVVTALAIGMPHLLQGTFGGRRGPLFLILSTLLFSWFLARGKRPSLVAIVISVVFLGMAMVVVKSQRQHLYLGSDGHFELSRVFDEDGVTAGEVDGGNSYFTGVAQILAADFYGDYHWGYRYFVTFFVRPIPKQIWPSKYEDVGATWLEQERNDEETGRFSSIVNLSLPRGVSGGSIADGYVEFSWGVILMFLLLGRVFAAIYWRHRNQGGFWTVLFLMMLALSVYLPSQSFSAWMHRLLFMGIFGYVCWRLFVGEASPREDEPRTPQPHRANLPSPAE